LRVAFEFEWAFGHRADQEFKQFVVHGVMITLRVVQP